MAKEKQGKGKKIKKKSIQLGKLRKDRSRLGKKSKGRSSQQASSKKSTSNKSFGNAFPLKCKDSLFQKTFHTASLKVDRDGKASVERFQVHSSWDGNKFSVSLGQNREGEEGHKCRISLDSRHRPDVEKVSAGNSYDRFFMDRCCLNKIALKEQVPFYVFSKPRSIKELDEGQLLIRVMTRHPKTPLLIQELDLKGKKILFKGEVWDERLKQFVPDLLIVLNLGEELNLRTKSGWFTLRNEGRGQVEIVNYVDEGPISLSKLHRTQLGGTAFDALKSLDLIVTEQEEKVEFTDEIVEEVEIVSESSKIEDSLGSSMVHSPVFNFQETWI